MPERLTSHNQYSTHLSTSSINAETEDKHSDDEHWDLVIRPSRSLLDIRLKEIWDYRDLLGMFVKRDIVTIYKQTVLGPIWFFIQPIMTMLVYIVVFGNIAKISTDGIPGPLFYLAGIVLWNYFAESFNKTASTFTLNANIFGKVYFPRLIVPLSLICSGLIKFAIQFGLFLAVWLWYYATTDALAPNAWIIATLYCVFLMACMGLGFGILFSSLTTKYRDLTFLIQFGVQLVMYATPIIYPMSVLSDRMRKLIWWNPIAHIVETVKHGFLGAGEVSVLGLAYSTVFAIAVLTLGILVFNRTEKTFVDTV